MKKIRLAITGCMGRMGQQIIRSVKTDNNFKITSLTETRELNKKINGIKVESNKEEVFKKVNLIIDFTSSICSLNSMTLGDFKKRVKMSDEEANKIKNETSPVALILTELDLCERAIKKEN